MICTFPICLRESFSGGPEIVASENGLYFSRDWASDLDTRIPPSRSLIRGAKIFRSNIQATDNRGFSVNDYQFSVVPKVDLESVEPALPCVEWVYLYACFGQALQIRIGKPNASNLIVDHADFHT